MVVMGFDVFREEKVDADMLGCIFTSHYSTTYVSIHMFYLKAMTFFYVLVYVYIYSNFTIGYCVLIIVS